MATNTQLKFYKLNSDDNMPASGLVKGAIYFVPKEGVIRVATSETTSEPYGGKLQNASWDQSKLKLTITKYDGSSLELDFSDMASSSAVTAEFAKHLGRIQALENQIGFTGEEGNRTWSANTEFYTKYTQKYDGAGEEVTKSEVEAKSIGQEVTNLDAAVHDLSVSVSKMVTSEVVSGLQARMVTAESDIDILQAATAGYDKENTIASAIAAAAAQSKTVVNASETEFSKQHLTVEPQIPADTDGPVTYVVEVKDLVDSSKYTADKSGIVSSINSLDGVVKVLEGKVDALSSATHFEGVVTWNPEEASISAKDNNGDYTINDTKYQSGDIVIYKPDTGQSKEYILDGSTDTPVFIELGDTTATDAAITAIDTQLSAIDGITGFASEGEDSGYQANNSKTDNVNYDYAYIHNAKNLNDADKELDKAIQAISVRVETVEGEVASVSGDNATISVNTTDRVATVSAMTNTLAEAQNAKANSTEVNGLAKAQDVYNALCWVEFK